MFRSFRIDLSFEWIISDEQHLSSSPLANDATDTRTEYLPSSLFSVGLSGVC